MAETIGILHPGAMGASVAAAARGKDRTVAWLTVGRGKATADRASAQDLLPIGDPREFCDRCAIILSVCPPEAAVKVAETVIGSAFQGIYVDANAISPAKARLISNLVASAGADYVDGGIVGPPAWKPGTCLYLSGMRSHEVARLFRGSPLEASVLGAETDTASALKMCYAARTKGVTALMANILAAAEALGVRDQLSKRWAEEDADLPARIEASVRWASPKAWRWVDEMKEIAATLDDAGADGRFHDAAAELYRALQTYKDADPLPDLNEILSAISGDRATSGDRRDDRESSRA